MSQVKRLTITDMMIGVFLTGAVVLAVKEPRLQESPDLDKNYLQFALQRPSPWQWLGPGVVSMLGVALLASSIGSRLAAGNWRTFLGGMALGGWLWFWLAFGTGEPAPLAVHFLPITWIHSLARGIRWEPEVLLLFSSSLVERSQYIFESIGCLIFATLCGGVAIGISRSAGDHPRLYAFVRRIVFSPVWLVIAAILLATTLGLGSWQMPDQVVSPPETAALLLFGLAAMLAMYGPSADRFAYGVFATVGVSYLAIACGPWSVGLRDLLPGHWIAERLAGGLLAHGSVPSAAARKSVVFAAFMILVQVLFAWLLALLAPRLAELSRSHALKTKPASTAPKGEPCPS
jgi:hypothetical protein